MAEFKCLPLKEDRQIKLPTEKGQTLIYKTQNRELKIEQEDSHKQKTYSYLKLAKRMILNHCVTRNVGWTIREWAWPFTIPQRCVGNEKRIGIHGMFFPLVNVKCN